ALARVQFHANVPMEALPFPDRHFDRVFSQYGFEYADLAAAADEACRVLAPGGEVALVCHHPESRLAQVASAEVAHIDWLLGPDGMVAALRAFVPYLSQPWSQPGQTASDAFDAVMRRMVERAQSSSVPDALHDAAQLARTALDLAARRPDAANELLGQWVEAVQDARLRSAELVTHALDDGRLRALCSAFETGGLSVETGTLYEQ